MDNANANVAAPAQTDPAPAAAEAANVTVPATPEVQPAAGATPAADPVAPAAPSFAPEIQKFLDNQNIKTDDPYAAIAELSRRHMKLRSEPQAVAQVLNQPATQPTPAPEPQPTQPTQPAQPAPQAPQHDISDMDIANVQMYVKSQYPDVTTNADFYREMIQDGFQPTANGQINLRAITSYAAIKQKLADADKVIAKANPSANQIPSPSNTPEYAQVDQVKTMDETAAQNIIMFSNQQKRFGKPIHPQYQSAVDYLRAHVWDKK